MPYIEFKVVNEAGRAVAARGRLHVSHASAEKVVEGKGGPAGRLSFVYPDGWTPRRLRFAAIPAGYWAMTIPAPPHKSQVHCVRLPSAKSLGPRGLVVARGA